MGSDMFYGGFYFGTVGINTDLQQNVDGFRRWVRVMKAIVQLACCHSHSHLLVICFNLCGGQRE